jgi:DNA repair protein RadC
MSDTDSLDNLLADCLRESTNGYVIHALLQEFPTVQELMNASEEDMMVVKGIGTAKAKQLSAILRFVRYIQSNPSGNRVIIRTPNDIYNLVRGKLKYLTVEQFVVVGLSTKNHVIVQHTVSVGSLNASIVHPRETFKVLIRRICASAILVHNHPSGDPEPSSEDITLTKKLIEVGQIIDIPVLDHVIVGQERYVSLKEKGII